MQVDVFKAMTNQRAITIQISSPQDNQPESTMVDTMIQSLNFNKNGRSYVSAVFIKIIIHYIKNRF